MPNLISAIWSKSSFSGAAEQNCVEVARLGAAGVAVRDSKNPTGPALTFSTDEWTAFVDGVLAGEFTLGRDRAAGSTTGHFGPAPGHGA
jgi:hypothetical protein